MFDEVGAVRNAEWIKSSIMIDRGKRKGLT